MMKGIELYILKKMIGIRLVLIVKTIEGFMIGFADCDPINDEDDISSFYFCR